MWRLNGVTSHQSMSLIVFMMDERGGQVVMTYGKCGLTVIYLLLNILFGGLSGRLGADVDGTRLALAIIWYAID